jgi:hypothetical protein
VITSYAPSYRRVGGVGIALRGIRICATKVQTSVWVASRMARTGSI